MWPKEATSFTVQIKIPIFRETDSLTRNINTGKTSRFFIMARPTHIFTSQVPGLFWVKQWNNLNFLHTDIIKALHTFKPQSLVGPIQIGKPTIAVANNRLVKQSGKIIRINSNIVDIIKKIINSQLEKTRTKE